MQSDKINNKVFKKCKFFFDLVTQKAKAGLRAEASRGYLGVFWWAIEPIMYMTVFYVIFAHLLHRGDENFVVFLLTGLIVWKWFHATVNIGSTSLLVNASLMNQVYIPKIIFPLTIITINTFKFFIIMALFLLFLQFTSTKPQFTWLLLPVLILTQLLFTSAVTCMFSAIMPFFPDLRVILDNILMMFLFLSGIFFDVARLPDAINKYVMLNPMAVLISMYREIILDGLLPDWNKLFAIILFSLSLWMVTALIFYRFDRIYPKIIN